MPPVLTQAEIVRASSGMQAPCWPDRATVERQLTDTPSGHILTNCACWSAEGQWLVYDTRSDAAGSRFDGRSIERVHVPSGRIERMFESQRGAHCGVVTCCPVTDRIVFILGPEEPTPDWQYAAYHRRGVLMRPGDTQPQALDAMCYAEPFKPGALRGGSHVHTFDPAGQRVAFTYEDHVLAQADRNRQPDAQLNQRNVGISVPGLPVHAGASHPRNHDGKYFSVLVTQTWDRPQPGSDQIDRAYEEAWLGTDGRALAFLGDVVAADGSRITELFALDLPEDLTQAGPGGPLQGTKLTRPAPPLGCSQRRITYTHQRRYPGVFGPRHWPRSLPDGSLIFFLMRDDHGQPQLWSIRRDGGGEQQLTSVRGGVTSAFSVALSGDWIAFVAEGCIWTVTPDGKRTRRWTEPTSTELAPRPEACVFSPDAQHIAFVRRINEHNQIFIVG